MISFNLDEEKEYRDGMKFKDRDKTGMDGYWHGVKCNVLHVYCHSRPNSLCDNK